MLIVKLFAIAMLIVVMAAWIAESYRNGNRLWIWIRQVPIEYLYDEVYLGAWRAMMRHSADPSYTHIARHAK